MNSLSLTKNAQAGFAHFVLLLAALIVIAIGFIGYRLMRSGDVNQSERSSISADTAPIETVTKDDDSSDSTVTVTNPKEIEALKSVDENDNSGGGEGSNPGSVASEGCIFHEYKGSELVSDVKAQIGQFVSYNDKASYVTAVQYSEDPSGQKSNIKYFFENGDDHISESEVRSVSGVPGYYIVDGVPIKVVDKPDSCPSP